MTIYEQNINQLKTYRIGLYNILKEHIDTQESNISNIESYEAKDGTKILSVEAHGKSYRMNSYYNPIQEADRWVEQYNFKNANCVISFFGLGNGIFVKKLVQKINKEDIIIVYEPSLSIFQYVIKEFDISDIIENDNILIIINGVNDKEFHSILSRTIDWSNIGSQVLCCHPFYDQIFISEYKSFLKDISNNNYQVFINRNTAALMGKAVVKNTIHNFKYLKNSNILSDLFERIPQNIPAIIVAAGPSLEKNISDLKFAKNKSIILATDRALDYLLDNEIDPDFIVTLDPIKPIKYFSRRDNIDIPLFSKIESNQEIIDYHKGRKIWYDSNEFFNNIYKKFNKPLTTVSSGGSVATAAFSICLELKISKIILVGQDLAYSGEYTHVGGVVGNGKIETNIIDYVEDIYGNSIPTRHDWKFFKLWFEDAISNFSCFDVIDATEGGAKIKGTKIMTLNEAISEYCNQEIDCKKIIDNIPYTLDTSGIKYVNDYIKESNRDLERIILDSKELIHICKKLLKACEKQQLDTPENQYLINKLSQINENIINKPIYTLIDTYISELSVEYLAGINKYSGEIQDDQSKTYTIALKIYETIELASKEVKVLVNKII
jgi:hypothetical protein